MFYSSTNTENLYHDFHNNIKQQKPFSTLIIIITIINNWELIVSMDIIHTGAYKKIEYHENIFWGNLFLKVKLSYIPHYM